jgi:hypothetical protein
MESRLALLFFGLPPAYGDDLSMIGQAVKKLPIAMLFIPIDILAILHRLNIWLTS